MKSPQKPLPSITKALGTTNEIWFKFENKHHYGSHKGRSIPFMIDEYFKTGIKTFIISSSGNAALAALRAVVAHNKNKPKTPINLKIFVGIHINKNKLSKLESEKTDAVILEQVPNPKQKALQGSKETATIWLRGSTDSLALTGYQSLADELSKISNLAAVFFATSSGTSAEGTGIGFKNLNIFPELHIVQTNYCHPITNYILNNQNKPSIPDRKNKSIADAIVDKVGYRKSSLGQMVIQSGGHAWLADEEIIFNTIKLIQKETDETVSANGALAVAGLITAIKAGKNWSGPVVCIIGGD